MKRQLSYWKNVPEGMELVCMIDIDIELLDKRWEFSVPAYLDRKERQFFVFFAPNPNDIIICYDIDLKVAGEMLKEKLTQYYQEK